MKLCRSISSPAPRRLMKGSASLLPPLPFRAPPIFAFRGLGVPLSESGRRFPSWMKLWCSIPFPAPYRLRRSSTSLLPPFPPPFRGGIRFSPFLPFRPSPKHPLPPPLFPHFRLRPFLPALPLFSVRATPLSLSVLIGGRLNLVPRIVGGCVIIPSLAIPFPSPLPASWGEPHPDRGEERRGCIPISARSLALSPPFRLPSAPFCGGRG